MTTPPMFRLAMVTIDCADAHELATFWATMLDGTKTDHGPDYAMVEAGGVALGFGTVTDYQPADWPNQHGTKQFHLDLAVDDLTEATTLALEHGATLADPQPAEADGKWVVLRDPSGHPFCLAIWP